MNYIYKISCFSLFILMIVLTFSCVLQIVNATQEKSTIQQYQRKINIVKSESENNYLASSNNVSLSNIEKVAREKMFVDSSDVIFVRSSATEVVIR